MPNPDETTTQVEQTEEAPRTFTQDEVDSIVKERLKREREKHADYDQLKEKAAKFDEAEEAAKSELQRSNERVQALEKELGEIKTQQQRQSIVAAVAKETGVDAELLAAMTGATEDEIKASADLLKEKFAAVPGYKPDPHDTGSQRHEVPKVEIPKIF